jgi:hypothetical protein
MCSGLGSKTTKTQVSVSVILKVEAVQEWTGQREDFICDERAWYLVV